MDSHLRVALDTTWLEGIDLGVLRDVASPPADLGANLSPRYAGYSYPVFPGVAAECVVGGDRATSGLDKVSMAAAPSPFLLPWQEDLRKKPLAYKSMSFLSWFENVTF